MTDVPQSGVEGAEQLDGASGGFFPRVHQLLGRIVFIRPTNVEDGLPSNGKFAKAGGQSRLTADMAFFTGDPIPGIVDGDTGALKTQFDTPMPPYTLGQNVWINNAWLVRALRKKISPTYPGTVGQLVKVGREYQLAPVSPEWVAHVNEWVQNEYRRLSAEAQAARPTAPAVPGAVPSSPQQAAPAMPGGPMAGQPAGYPPQQPAPAGPPPGYGQPAPGYPQQPQQQYPPQQPAPAAPGGYPQQPQQQYPPQQPAPAPAGPPAGQPPQQPAQQFAGPSPWEQQQPAPAGPPPAQGGQWAAGPPPAAPDGQPPF